MVDEVRRLIEQGIQPDDLIYYGLEYKYLTLYVIGKLTYEEMYRELEIAIHQFAKRQMTWFRGMERRGFTIHWMDAGRAAYGRKDCFCTSETRRELVSLGQQRQRLRGEYKNDYVGLY